MTIKYLSDAIVEKYRPYVNGQTKYIDWSQAEETRNAVLCGITEVEARIKDCLRFMVALSTLTWSMESVLFKRVHDELTAILNELKSRI